MQLTDEPPQLISTGARRQRPALNVLTQVDGFSIAPNPHAAGVEAPMRVATKSRIQLDVGVQFLPIQSLDIPRTRLRGWRQNQHSGDVQRVGQQLRRHQRYVERVERIHLVAPQSHRVTGTTVALGRLCLSRIWDQTSDLVRSQAALGTGVVITEFQALLSL